MKRTTIGHIRFALGWFRWVRQGRKRNFPVVVKAGEILSCRHGHALAQNWHWDTRYMRASIEVSHMVDILGAQYGIKRVHELRCCAACQNSVTV